MAPGIRVEAVAIVWATDIHNWFRTGAAAVQASKETPPTPPVNWS